MALSVTLYSGDQGAYPASRDVCIRLPHLACFHVIRCSSAVQRCADPRILSLRQSADFDLGSAYATGEKYWIRCQSTSAVKGVAMHFPEQGL